MPARSIVVGALCGLVLLALPGCAARDAAWVNEHLSLSENFHAGTMVLETPELPETGAHRAILRATARTRGPRIGADVELAVRARFDDFSFLDRVSFTSGRAYPLTVEKRETEDCGTTDQSLCDVFEHVSIKLSRDFLKAKRASGFYVKLWGRRDSVVIDVPPEWIEGLLARMEDRPPEVVPAAARVPSAPTRAGRPGSSAPAAPAPRR